MLDVLLMSLDPDPFQRSIYASMEMGNNLDKEHFWQGGYPKVPSD
jgi:hypothetical protein